MNPRDKMLRLSARAAPAVGWAMALLASACDSGAEKPPVPAAQSRAAPAAEQAPAPAAAGKGKIAGTALFDGAVVPEMKAIEVNVDVPHCGGKVKEESRIVNAANRGLKNVVVAVEGVPVEKPAAPGVLQVANQGCAFVPHVAAVVAGTTLEVPNSDPVQHTTHGYDVQGSFFNVSIAPGAPPIRRPLRRPGVVQLQCDIHKWMRAWIIVHPTPHFAVSDADGRFEIPELPAGTYTVKAWHEDLGTRTASVTVEAEKSASLEFRFKPE